MGIGGEMHRLVGSRAEKNAAADQCVRAETGMAARASACVSLCLALLRAHAVSPFFDDSMSIDCRSLTTCMCVYVC